MDRGTNILIIAGMHRSGTSLITNWLRECGLNVGTELLAANEHNASGYFEDLDFFNFHRALLKARDIHHFPKQEVSFEVSQSDIKNAEKLIHEKRGKGDFGFKDPRTCLFINQLWDKVIPGASCLIIFRHPQAVIHSLLEREWKAQTAFWQRWKWPLVKGSLQHRFENAYQLYNKSLIQYFKKNENRSYILDLEQVETQAPKALVWLNHQGFDLDYINIRTILDPQQLHSVDELSALTLSADTLRVYDELKALTTKERTI